MNVADMGIAAILLLSVVVGLLRGFISEVWALACWICAGWLAWYCGPLVVHWLPDDLATPGARLVIACAICFVLVLVTGALIGFLLRRLVGASGLSGSDRLLGMVFGLVRGVALVVLLVVMVQFTPFQRDDWWRESRLVPVFGRVADWARAHWPAELSDYWRERAASAPETPDRR